MEIFNKQAHLFVSSRGMLKKARLGNYAVGQFNANDLEGAKTILEVGKETNSPIILAFSQSAIKYMGGPKAVYGMAAGLMEDLNIVTPVALHLDHCDSLRTIKKVIDIGFTSVMYDGSSYEFETNYKDTSFLLSYINKTIPDRDVSVEVELGKIGGKEDTVTGKVEYANINECRKLSTLKISNSSRIAMLAVGIGNIHGVYPENYWKNNNLNFELLEQIKSVVDVPLVLHGGSGIPVEKIKKAINLGINKINVNTECQIAFAEGVKRHIKYIENKKRVESFNEEGKNIFKLEANTVKCEIKKNSFNEIVFHLSFSHFNFSTFQLSNTFLSKNNEKKPLILVNSELKQRMKVGLDKLNEENQNSYYLKLIGQVFASEEKTENSVIITNFQFLKSEKKDEKIFFSVKVSLKGKIFTKLLPNYQKEELYYLDFLLLVVNQETEVYEKIKVISYNEIAVFIYKNFDVNNFIEINNAELKVCQDGNHCVVIRELPKFIKQNSTSDNYDPRKLLKPGYDSMKLKIKELLRIFGSYGEA